MVTVWNYITTSNPTIPCRRRQMARLMDDVRFAEDKDMRHLTKEQLLGNVEALKASPQDHGILEMIVIRPEKNERMVLERCDLSSKLGVHGDNWVLHCQQTLPDGGLYPGRQVSIMNSRSIALLAQEMSRWSLAGDNLYVDFDLSAENITPGQRLAIGTCVLEVTGEPHDGCAKFVERFGKDALDFVNSDLGKHLHLRGVFAKIVRDGAVIVGDPVEKI